MRKKKKPVTSPKDYTKPNILGELKPIKEAFSWISPEWKALPAGKKTAKVKGVALTSDVISKNKRKYLDEELKMAARTLAGKPINVNHTEVVAGNVIHAEYENGAIEFLGQIKKEPYVSMLKNRDANIKGVSVQAAYIHNQCVNCGEKFFTEKAWRVHMLEEHGIKDGVEEVHGIIFDALSLVVGDEIPGVPTATIELMETDRNSTVLRLFETVLKEKGQLGEPEDEHGCEPGEVWNPETEECEAKVEEQEEPEKLDDSKGEQQPICPEGQVFNPLSKQCESASQVASQIEAISKVATKEQITEIYKAILDVADNSVAHMKERVKEVEGDLAKKCDTIIEMLGVLKTVYVDNKVKQITETTDRNKKLEALETRLDNLEHKQRGNFKGGTKPELTESTQDDGISKFKPYDPNRKKKEK